MSNVHMPRMSEMSGNRVFTSLLLLFLSCGTPGNTVKDVCDTGKAQSPVDIKVGNTIDCGSDFKPLRLSYSPASTAHFTNTGHTVKITVEDSARTSYTVQGGPLKEEYVLSEVHFHWGQNDKEGSEHTINSNRYSMEAHVVHYKKIYGTFEKALEHDDGLTVIAFFFQAQRNKNCALRLLTEAVTNLTRKHTNTTLNTDDALDWILESASKGKPYFSYEGSLTTPPCAEIVSWIVFKKPVKISSKQLEVFRKLQAHGKDITPNFREIYPLNGRVIRNCIV